MSQVERKIVPGGGALVELFVQDGIEYTHEEWSRKQLFDKLDRIIERLVDQPSKTVKLPA